jgi:hypothetical protein
VTRAAALVLAGCALVAASCAPYRVLRAGQVNATAAARVKAKLVTLRGLRFSSAVPVQAVTAEEARKLLERELRAQYSVDELARLSRVYVALGLLPQGSDLERAYLELYAHQVAGFYDPIERRMVLVENATAPDLLTRVVGGVLRRDFAGELVLAHELTHALQDQHYGLDVSRTDLGEDDAALARHAVYEGDATLAGFGVVLGTLKPSSAVSLAAKLEGVPGQLARAYPEIPDAIRESVIFQYVAGVNFVSWAYQRAGWEGVNALLARPPLSTEQILHPEKYFMRAEYPLSVKLGGTSPYVQAGWQSAEEATLGEFTIQVLGDQFLSRTRAAAMAAGWDGDRLLALSRGEDIALVWLTAWDTEKDAPEFLEAYATILAAKHPQGAPETRDDALVSPASTAPYRVERRGTKVLVVEGLLDPDLARVTERVWRRSSYEPAMPWLPIDLAAASGRTAAR